MRYAILSDIHANLDALTAVLQTLAGERIDQYVSLGDAIGYGAEPAAVLERLRRAQAIAVAGNHEQACIGKLDDRWFNEAARAAIQWTRDRLNAAELDELRRLPLTRVDGPCTLVHASLPRPERFEYLVDLAQVVDALAACQTLFCLAGHTHVPCVVEYDRSAQKIGRVLTSARELSEVLYTDDASAMRYLVNPGSVGQPRDGNPEASFGLLDTGAKRLWIRRVPYDVASAQERIRAAGLPAFLAQRLGVGR